jgi:hypothetical protein
MKDHSEEFQEAYDEKQYPAKIQITVDEDGVIEYNCDWASKDGIVSLSSLFYKILYDDLISLIIEDIHSICKNNNEEEDYYLMIDMISRMSQLQQEEDNEEDPVVIPPDKISNIL